MRPDVYPSGIQRKFNTSGSPIACSEYVAVLNAGVKATLTTRSVSYPTLRQLKYGLVGEMKGI